MMFMYNIMIFMCDGRERNMDQTQEKIEALQVLKKYNIEIIKGIDEIAGELRGSGKEDTDQFLTNLLGSINWEVQVLARTMDYLNRDAEKVSKDEVNGILTQLNDAVAQKDGTAIADCMQYRLKPFLEHLHFVLEFV